MQKPHKDQSEIALNGTAFENGQIIGKLAGQPIINSILRLHEKLREKKTPKSYCKNRSQAFEKLLDKVAPDWLEEAEAMADGAGVDLDDILLLNCNPIEFYHLPKNNCTSFIRIEPERILLCKIRDTQNQPQQFFVKSNQGRLGYQGGTTIGHLGLGHVFSETGIAGACNTGGVIDYPGVTPQFDDCHSMRFIAERASSLTEIPDIYQHLIEKGAVCGSGYNRGTILLFADHNRGLLLESANHHFETQFIESDFLAVSNHFLLPTIQKLETSAPDSNTLLRKSRMDELLAQIKSGTSISSYFVITRDTLNSPYSLCNADTNHPWMTISAQIQAINRSQPDQSINWFCCGNPINSFYLPWHFQNRLSFDKLVSGEFYSAADQLYKKHRLANPDLEKHIEYEKEMVDACYQLKQSCDTFDFNCAGTAYNKLIHFTGKPD